MQNRYPGKCACGTFVHAGEGVTFKADGRWAVRCMSCEEHPAPVREMGGCIYWPNGMGYTECTLAYQEAADEARRAREECSSFEEMMDTRDPEQRKHHLVLDHAAHAAENALYTLQAEGGHIGERVRFEEADPYVALLGGGSVTIADGAMRVAD